jgi:hypothetical protein
MERFVYVGLAKGCKLIKLLILRIKTDIDDDLKNLSENAIQAINMILKI